MRVLVTGATGFIGRVVARELVREGHQVRALVRGSNPQGRLVEAGLADVEVAAGDLDDGASLARAVAGCDAVAHLAAIVGSAPSAATGDLDRTNRAAAVDLAERARAAGAKRFVFVSSIAAMGFWSGVARADSPCSPTTPYGRAKLDAERAILALATPAFSPIVLRPPTVYGPGERANFLALARAVDRGLFVPIGSGENVFPLATAENVARAVSAAAAGTIGGGVALVADREAYPMRRIYAAIARALGRTPRSFTLPVGLANVVALGNELVARVGAPLLLSRARVRTLTADQPFDVGPLLAAGVALDALLEETVRTTIEEYRHASVL